MARNFEKSWGGYSTHALPTVNADVDNIPELLEMYASIEKFDDPKVVDLLLNNDIETAMKLANPRSKVLINKITKQASMVKQSKDRLLRLILTAPRLNKIYNYETMFGDVIIQMLRNGDFEGALQEAQHPKIKELIVDIKNIYQRYINRLGLKMVW